MKWVIIQDGHSDALAGQLTPAWLANVAQACTNQLNWHVAPQYGGAPYSVRVGTDDTDLQPGESPCTILDELPDNPSPIAKHLVELGTPVAYVSLAMCHGLTDVSVAISHELCEAAVDSACDTWLPDGKGNKFAKEICDPVESNHYPVAVNGVIVTVSDFVLPAFFAPGAAGPYSIMQSWKSDVPVPPGPFQAARGGYEMKLLGNGSEVEVDADQASLRGTRLLAGKVHWSSRPGRRGLKTVR